MAELIGVILAGGASLRMGSPKHAIEIAPGATMIELVASAISQVCDRLVVAASAPTGLDVPHLPDRRDGRLGPLAGIEAAHAANHGATLCVCACDQPWLTAAVLLKIIQQHAPCVDASVTVFADAKGRPEPLPMIVDGQAAARATALLNSERRALRDLIGEVGGRYVAASPSDLSAIRSVNRPEDLV